MLYRLLPILFLFGCSQKIIQTVQVDPNYENEKIVESSLLEMDRSFDFIPQDVEEVGILRFRNGNEPKKTLFTYVRKKEDETKGFYIENQAFNKGEKLFVHLGFPSNDKQSTFFFIEKKDGSSIYFDLIESKVTINKLYDSPGKKFIRIELKGKESKNSRTIELENEFFLKN